MNNYEQIKDKFSPPLYIFNIQILKERITYLKSKLLPQIDLCYAIKANPFIVYELNNMVKRFEVCSPGELNICKELNINLEKIVLSGVYKTPSIIEDIFKNDEVVGIFTVESMCQFELLKSLSSIYKKTIKILVRLTSGNQFGVNEEELFTIPSLANEYIHIVGIEYFSGTQKHSIKRIEREVDYLKTILTTLKEQYHLMNLELEYGPGFPVYYFQEEFDEDDFIENFNNIIKKIDVKVTLELGRSIAASCGSYMTSVVDIKKNKAGNYAIVDGGMHQLVYYGQTLAMKVPEYELIPKRHELTEPWNICGSLCTINDLLVKQLLVPPLKIGDTFVFKNTGAYCMCEGISLFLSRDLPKIIIVDEQNNIKLVREVVETASLNTPKYGGE